MTQDDDAGSAQVERLLGGIRVLRSLLTIVPIATKQLRGYSFPFWEYVRMRHPAAVDAH